MANKRPIFDVDVDIWRQTTDSMSRAFAQLVEYAFGIETRIFFNGEQEPAIVCLACKRFARLSNPTTRFKRKFFHLVPHIASCPFAELSQTINHHESMRRDLAVVQGDAFVKVWDDEVQERNAYDIELEGAGDADDNH